MSTGLAIRALYAHLCDTMNACPPLMSLLDPARPIRRMEWGVEEPWQDVLTYGRATRRRHVPGSRRPIYTITVEFAPWIRGEAAASTMGDLILADIEELLVKMFDDEQPKPDTCDEFIMLESMFDDFSTPAEFIDERQAWTQIHRFRFDIIVPSCRPVAENCFGICPE